MTRPGPHGAFRYQRIVAVAAIALGGWLLVTSLAQPIKATIGESLLDRTFAERLAADESARHDETLWRPWSGADLTPVAEVRFPRLDEHRVIVDSASGEALAWAVGHMRGTAELGTPGISAIAGHRDGRFELLKDVQKGDDVELTTLNGETTRYVVTELTVVDSRTTQMPVVHSGPDELVMVTCWPIDAVLSGPERLLVRAVATPGVAPDDGLESRSGA